MNVIIRLYFKVQVLFEIIIIRQLGDKPTGPIPDKKKNGRFRWAGRIGKSVPAFCGVYWRLFQ